MNPLMSGGLLAASLLLGQTPEPPPRIIVPAAPAVQPAQPAPSRPILGFFTREDRPILNRIQAWFKRDQPDANRNSFPVKDKVIRETAPPPIAIPMTTTPAVNDFPRKLPNPSNKATTTPAPLAKEASQSAKKIEQTTLAQGTSAKLKAAKNRILPYLADRIGRDEKFEWITGQLEIENGKRVLYYATPETIDKFHGRIVLEPQKVDLAQYHRGDLVSVRGQLVQTKTSHGVVPTYRVTMASLIDRAKR